MCYEGSVVLVWQRPSDSWIGFAETGKELRHGRQYPVEFSKPAISRIQPIAGILSGVSHLPDPGLFPSVGWVPMVLVCC